MSVNDPNVFWCAALAGRPKLKSVLAFPWVPRRCLVEVSKILDAYILEKISDPVVLDESFDITPVEKAVASVRNTTLVSLMPHEELGFVRECYTTQSRPLSIA